MIAGLFLMLLGFAVAAFSVWQVGQAAFSPVEELSGYREDILRIFGEGGPIDDQLRKQEGLKHKAFEYRVKEGWRRDHGESGQTSSAW